LIALICTDRTRTDHNAAGGFLMAPVDTGVPIQFLNQIYIGVFLYSGCVYGDVMAPNTIDDDATTMTEPRRTQMDSDHEYYDNALGNICRNDLEDLVWDFAWELDRQTDLTITYVHPVSGNVVTVEMFDNGEIAARSDAHGHLIQGPDSRTVLKKAKDYMAENDSSAYRDIVDDVVSDEHDIEHLDGETKAYVQMHVITVRPVNGDEYEVELSFPVERGDTTVRQCSRSVVGTVERLENVVRAYYDGRDAIASIETNGER
jgi:hypothetical protein